MKKQNYLPGIILIKFIDTVPVDSKQAKQIARKNGATTTRVLVKDMNLMEATVPVDDEDNFIKKANLIKEIEYAEKRIIRTLRKK